jgi:2-phosphosulfolactate phosphatase
MKVDAILSPTEFGMLADRDLSRTTCVVFDVLRATSCIVTAFAYGAEGVIPVLTIEEAFAIRADRPEVILGGERGGNLIPGFDVGNSPHEYTDFGRRVIVSTTTNGTVALRAVAHAGRVLVGSLLNIGAIARFLNQERPEELLLVCAGTGATFALEDAFAVGCLAAEFHDGFRSDAVTATTALASRQNSDAHRTLSQGANGRTLIGAGRAADVAFCAQFDLFDVVPELHRGMIRCIRGTVLPPGALCLPPDHEFD